MTSSHASKACIAAILLTLGLGVQPASAARPDRGRPFAGGIERQGEPRGYTRFEPPAAAQQRPRTPDAGLFHHNFTASRGYHVGPYRAPGGYRYRRLHYGQILPPIFWGLQYRLTDYWLFGLDIPPVGYEWVRYGPDALLVDMTTGEVVSEVYDDFL